jgi:hypothetical protein
MRESDIDDMGIKIGGRNITNLRYADDTALLADNITSMRKKMYIELMLPAYTAGSLVFPDVIKLYHLLFCHAYSAFDIFSACSMRCFN